MEQVQPRQHHQPEQPGGPAQDHAHHGGAEPLGPVSYTHLDVYKRQHLAHDDFRSQVADFLPGAAQQARGGVLHDFRQGGDAHDERCV